MLELRAIQTELFVQALDTYERTAIANDDLKALGGDVLEVVKARRLIRAIPNRPKTTYRVLLEPDERRAIFLLRWTELAGLTQSAPFRLAPSWVILGSDFRLRPKLVELGSAELKVIERLGEADPTYPAALAKGLLLTRLGAYDAAAASFREFLAQAPDAPYRQRAKNHLTYVQQFISPDG
jgi:tetratricopeptide (TPR) repeat protein